MDSSLRSESIHVSLGDAITNHYLTSQQTDLAHQQHYLKKIEIFIETYKKTSLYSKAKMLFQFFNFFGAIGLHYQVKEATYVPTLSSIS